MSKSVLIIDDYKSDFQDYYDLIHDEAKFLVYPDRNANLSELFGLKNKSGATIEEKKEAFIRTTTQYIIDKELYQKISVIILDIKIFDDNDEDKTGLELLEHIRKNIGEKLPEKFKKWGNVIPIIALTNYSPARYKNEFMQNAGSLLQFFYKANVEVNSNSFISTLKNFDTQMTEIYSLFYEPELKSILTKVERNNIALKDLKDIASLSLYSQIASMEEEKRNALIDNFSSKLIEHTKSIDGFMLDIENIENQKKFKEKIVSIFKTSSKAINFISSLLAFSGEYVDAEKISNIIEKSISLFSDLYKG